MFGLNLTDNILLVLRLKDLAPKHKQQQQQPEQQQQHGLRSQWGHSCRCWIWSTRGELMWRTRRNTFMHPSRFNNKLLQRGFTIRCEMRVLHHPHQRSARGKKKINCKKEKKWLCAEWREVEFLCICLLFWTPPVCEFVGQQRQTERFSFKVKDCSASFIQRKSRRN